LPLDPRVRAVLDSQRRTFESLGCVVEDVSPDLRDAETGVHHDPLVPLGRELRPAARPLSRPAQA
jgi:hypothetical protein